MCLQPAIAMQPAKQQELRQRIAGECSVLKNWSELANLCWYIQRLNRINEWELCTWFLLSTNQIFDVFWCDFHVKPLPHIGLTRSLIPVCNDKKKLVTHCYWCLCSWSLNHPFFFYVFHENNIRFRVHSKHIFCHCHQFVYWHSLLGIVSHLNAGENVFKFGQIIFFSRRLTTKPRCQMCDNNWFLWIIWNNWKTINIRHNSHNNRKSYNVCMQWNAAPWF